MTCTNCPHNQRQASLIKRLWHTICRLKRRIKTQQYIIDQLRKPEPLTAQQRAEQIFKGANNG